MSVQYINSQRVTVKPQDSCQGAQLSATSVSDLYSQGTVNLFHLPINLFPNGLYTIYRFTFRLLLSLLDRYPTLLRGDI